MSGVASLAAGDPPTNATAGPSKFAAVTTGGGSKSRSKKTKRRAKAESAAIVQDHVEGREDKSVQSTKGETEETDNGVPSVNGESVQKGVHEEKAEENGVEEEEQDPDGDEVGDEEEEKEDRVEENEEDEDGEGVKGGDDPEEQEEEVKRGEEEKEDEEGEEDDEAEEEEEDEDEDEDEDDEEDDDEDEEPALKYTRLKGKVPEILGRDTASAIDVSPQVIALGTHNGMVHVLTYEGAKVNSFRPHAASVTSLRLDEDNDFVATASVEGRVVIHSLTSTESYAFDYKRPMRCLALEPGFAKKTTRAFVCGGMAGNLVLQEKGWLGYKEQILHSGEGPIWAVEWRGSLIAWANDLGVKIYDTVSGQRIGFVDRGANAPRAELFKCSLVWKDDRTLVIGWADHVRIVRVRSRPRTGAGVGVGVGVVGSGAPLLSLELNSVWQVDCMVSGLSPFQQTAYVVLAYIPPDTYENEATEDRAEQRRKAANRPELRIIDRGEEVAGDELAIASFEKYGCNDYALVRSKRPDEVAFLVLTPTDLIVVRPRDQADHIEWLVERERFQEALDAADALRKKHGQALDVAAIGLKYMHHLVERGDFTQAASLSTKVLAQDGEAWETWIHTFAKHEQLPAIIPYIPKHDPRLSRDVYEMIFAYLIVHDKPALLQTVTSWPADIYDINTVMSAVEGELAATKDDPVLLECLAELYIIKRQPAKALPFYLRLRKPNVFDLIRDHNLFTAVQDQALLLVEFDQERRKTQKEGNGGAIEPEVEGKHGAAIKLLIDHTHSIPIVRAVSQLEAKPQYLYMYLDSLFDKDPGLCLQYSDRMVELYAAYDVDRLMPFLRASNYYDLEHALAVCKERDYVAEMVFLLGRMGNNKQALMLIIERLGNVEMAIDFAKEQADEDLWEDLLQYSETRPDFIRALLEHVGAEINPIRLIRRIRDGLEIPGLKPALVTILQASNLQVSLLEGCQHILDSDGVALAADLQAGQTGSAKGSPRTRCNVCGNLLLSPPALNQSSVVPSISGDPPLSPSLSYDAASAPPPSISTSAHPPPPTLIYLCRHMVHAACALPSTDIDLPDRAELSLGSGSLASASAGSVASPSVAHLLGGESARSPRVLQRGLAGKLSYAAAVRVRVGKCPVCLARKGDGGGVVGAGHGTGVIPSLRVAVTA